LLSTIDDDRPFARWLRTGRLPRVRSPDGIELKFNPWHDPKDGRFTFRGSGRYFGGGGASGSWSPTRPERRPSGRPSAPPRRDAVGLPAIRQHARHAASPTIEQHIPTWHGDHVVQRNGYTFHLDDQQRTREVTGEIHLAEKPVRSRALQAAAGGAERRPLDDGGHYIASRFGGPAEAFNHFAQDRHFNRGAYRELENEWAAATRQGARVDVDITPRFRGSSIRPYSLNVVYHINGTRKEKDIGNER
jgi:hypothetical protein